MGEQTKIQWCHHTWNPWRGCSHAALPDGTSHPGCDHCYAEQMAKRNPGTLGIWGEHGKRIRAVAKTFKLPLEWDKQARKAGEIHTVFVDSMSDFFEDWRGPIFGPAVKDDDGIKFTPHLWWRSDMGVVRAGQTTINHSRGERLATMDDVRRDAFKIIDQCQNLRFLILTKRPQNIRRMWAPVVTNSENWFFDPEEQKARGLTHAGPHKSTLTVVNGDRRNVWLLASVSDQPTADTMIPPLLQCRDLVPVLGVSAEPLLGPIDFTIRYPISQHGDCHNMNSLRGYGGWDIPRERCRLDWVIVGGESGPGARPCDAGWISSIRDQCRAAGVACFIKQLGSNPVEPLSSFDPQELGTIPIKLRDSKGGDMNEWPVDLRVREFPQATVRAE